MILPTVSSPVRIAMWSTPRSLSTALMRSWGNRPDTIVADEPLHAAHLSLGDWEFDGMQKTFERYEKDWQKVVAQLTGPLPKGKSIYYQKHFACHIGKQMEEDWILELTNCFLIRDPKEVISSYIKKWPEVSQTWLGFPKLLEIFEFVKKNTGKVPPVIDARDLQTRPKETLMRLCEKVNVPFSDTMLHWKKGIRATDGPWTDRGWYDKVAESTTFKPYTPKPIEIPKQFESLVKECEEVYENMRSYTNLY